MAEIHTQVSILIGFHHQVHTFWFFIAWACVLFHYCNRCELKLVSQTGKRLWWGLPLPDEVKKILHTGLRALKLHFPLELNNCLLMQTAFHCVSCASKEIQWQWSQTPQKTVSGQKTDKTDPMNCHCESGREMNAPLLMTPQVGKLQTRKTVMLFACQEKTVSIIQRWQFCSSVESFLFGAFVFSLFNYQQRMLV